MSTSPTDGHLPSGCDEIPIPVGRLVLTAKRVVAPDPDAILSSLGGDGTIVCLNPARELAQWPEYEPWLRSNQPQRALWFSMPDWNAPPLDEVEVLLDDIIERLGQGRTVVVHCSHGQGRAGTVGVATLMKLGTPRHEAERRIAECRPGAGPLGGSQSALIAQLEQRLAD